MKVDFQAGSFRKWEGGEVVNERGQEEKDGQVGEMVSDAVKIRGERKKVENGKQGDAEIDCATTLLVFFYHTKCKKKRGRGK